MFQNQWKAGVRLRISHLNVRRRKVHQERKDCALQYTHTCFKTNGSPPKCSQSGKSTAFTTEAQQTAPQPIEKILPEGVTDHPPRTASSSVTTQTQAPTTSTSLPPQPKQAERPSSSDQVQTQNRQNVKLSSKSARMRFRSLIQLPNWGRHWLIT